MRKAKYFFHPSGPNDDARIAKVSNGINHEPTWYYLACTSYLAAENILKDRSGGTFFIWPFLILFRNGVELMLKSIHVDLMGKSIQEATGYGHDIEKLLNKALENRNIMAKDLSLEEEFLLDFIGELAALDKNGDAFRYGRNRNGIAFWEDWPESTNADILKRNCNKLFFMLRDLHGFPESEKRKI